MREAAYGPESRSVTRWVAEAIYVFCGRGTKQYRERAPNGIYVTWEGWPDIEQLLIPNISEGGKLTAMGQRLEHLPLVPDHELSMILKARQGDDDHAKTDVVDGLPRGLGEKTGTLVEDISTGSSYSSLITRLKALHPDACPTANTWPCMRRRRDPHGEHREG